MKLWTVIVLLVLLSACCPAVPDEQTDAEVLPVPTWTATPLPVATALPVLEATATLPTVPTATALPVPTAVPTATLTVLPTPTKQVPDTAPPVPTCCKHCGPNSQPCGDSCISLKYTCHVGKGCACK